MHRYCSASVFDFSCLEHFQSLACSVITKISPTTSPFSTVELASFLNVTSDVELTLVWWSFSSQAYICQTSSSVSQLMGQTSDRKLQTCRPFSSPAYNKIVLYRKLQSRRKNLWTQVSTQIIKQIWNLNILGKFRIFLFYLPRSGQNR